jgi:hypothetical protein
MTPTPTLDVADPPRECLLGRVVIALTDLLAHDFEDVMLERAEHAAGEQACPLGQSAEAAHRITTLCRQLREQLNRYERFDRMCREAEADQVRQKTKPAADLPF